MSINCSEVAASTSSQISSNSNNEDTSSSKAAKKTKIQSSISSLENKFSTVVTKHIGSFLEDADLSRFLKTARFSRAACQSDMAERKRVKEELLPHIFGGAPDAVDTFFKTQGTTFATLKLLLTKARFREGYQSQKFNQFICFREWRGVSPLQAAALCGDVFLLDNLKQLIIKENKCRLEAIQQLEEVRSRISAQKIILEAANVVVETFSDDQAKQDAANLRLKEIKQSEAFQRQMAAFRKEMEVLRNQMTNFSAAASKAQQQKDASASAGSSATSAGPTFTATRPASAISSGPMALISIQSNCSSSADRKTQTETKASSENNQITYADNAEFLAPVTHLLKAYIDFFIQTASIRTLQMGRIR